MASLTVRGLSDELKRRLRLRAAGNGRSVEEEIRHILKGAARGDAPLSVNLPAARPSQPASAGGRALPEPAPDAHATATICRVLLIIGGGIAAYKSLDLIRRLQDHDMAVRCILTEAAQEF